MLQSIDEDRIDLLHKIFQDFGYHGLDVTMRARVTYYHQLGYYALKVREKRETRLELALIMPTFSPGVPGCTNSRRQMRSARECSATPRSNRSGMGLIDRSRAAAQKDPPSEGRHALDV